MLPLSTRALLPAPPSNVTTYPPLVWSGSPFRSLMVSVSSPAPGMKTALSSSALAAVYVVVPSKITSSSALFDGSTWSTYVSFPVLPVNTVGNRPRLTADVVALAVTATDRLASVAAIPLGTTTRTVSAAAAGRLASVNVPLAAVTVDRSPASRTPFPFASTNTVTPASPGSPASSVVFPLLSWKTVPVTDPTVEAMAASAWIRP